MRQVKFARYFIFTFILLSSPECYSVPIDWYGSFGVDTTYIDAFRKIEATSLKTSSVGSQEVGLASGNHDDASFQSYLVQLSPVLIINDSASIKAEISSGYGRGGRIGEESSTSRDNDFANSLYYHNTSSFSTSLN